MTYWPLTPATHTHTSTMVFLCQVAADSKLGLVIWYFLCIFAFLIQWQWIILWHLVVVSTGERRKAYSGQHTKKQEKKSHSQRHTWQWKRKDVCSFSSHQIKLVYSSKTQFLHHHHCRHKAYSDVLYRIIGKLQHIIGRESKAKHLPVR